MQHFKEPFDEAKITNTAMFIDAMLTTPTPEPTSQYERIQYISSGGLGQAAPGELLIWKHYGLWTVVITDRLVRLCLDAFPTVKTVGPFQKVLGRWLLYRYRRPEWCATEYWTINPFTLAGYPFWHLWRCFERRISWTVVSWLFAQGVLAWPECQTLRYRDIPKALWFTKQARAECQRRGYRAYPKVVSY